MSLLLLLLLQQFVRAEVSEKDIINDVLSQFPSVQMAKEDITIASGENTAAEGAFDLITQSQYTQSTGDYDYQFLQTRVVKPVSLLGIDLYGGYKKGTGKIPIYDGQLETLDKGEFFVGGKLPLLRGLMIDERRANLKKSKLAIEQRQFQFKAVELEQVRLALHRYWDWRLAKKRLHIQKQLLENAEQRDRWLNKRATAGDIARFELNDNRRTILQRQSILLQSEQLLNQSTSELEYFLNQENLIQELQNSPNTTDEIMALPTDIESYTKNNFLQQAIEARPEFAVLKNQKEQLNIDQELQSNRWLPQLDVETQFSKDRGQGPSSLDDDNLKININLEIPLQYRRQRGREMQIRGSLNKLSQQNKLLEQKLRMDLQILQRNLKFNLKRFELANQEIQLASMLEKGERTKLLHGETNVLMVNLREQASAEAQLRLAEAQTEIQKNFISLKTAIGHLP